jgi:hypothetical protein
MATEHRTAIEIARKVCLHCREQGVEADGTCGRCRGSSTIAPEPMLPAARWPRPAWTLVKEANENQDFYECVALSGVARKNPGPEEAKIKEISILFDYEKEHTLVYKRWLEDMDVQIIPTELKMVTSSLGRPVETRQIAIIPLEKGRVGSEPVVIAAWVVEESTWSKRSAPAIKNLRERFLSRPLIPMAHTARKRAIMDLVVGRDNRRIFPELSQEACLMGDDFFICNILFRPGQVVCGAAQKSIQWVKNLENQEEAKKSQFRYLGKAKSKAKGKARPAEVAIVRRISVASSAGQSPHHGLQDDIYEVERGSSCRGETPIPSDLEADFPEPEVQRLLKVTGDPDFCQHREVLELPESGEPAAAEGGENFGGGREVVTLPEAGEPAPEGDADLLAYAMGTSLQVAEQRLIYFVQEGVPELRLEEAYNE